MRDIRSDLRDRLAAISRQREAAEAEHKSRLAAIDQQEVMLSELIRVEDARAAEAHKNLSLKNGAANPLEHEILTLLETDGTCEHGKIKDEMIARGLGKAADPQFGRVIQGHLLSMKGRKLVDTLGEGNWRIHRKTRETAGA